MVKGGSGRPWFFYILNEGGRIMKTINTNSWSRYIGIALLFGTVAVTPGVQADSNLPPVDNFLTTLIDKSVIAGSIEKDQAGMIAVDANGNLKFNYTGKIYAVATSGGSGQLKALESVIGSIQGQASFPMSFAGLAMGMKAYMDGVGPLPAISPVIPWTCNSCRMVVGNTTYVSIVDLSGQNLFSDDAINDMRMQGRAFTGLGPVEIGKLSAQSMSVRMAGCSAVVGVDGPNAGMLGTLCLNGTFTFDLAGIDLSNPMASNIVGTGTSNCITVLHTPIM
jgi:hypothetical protein